MNRFPEPLDWGGFITTVISVNTFWWIWDIPLIWQRGFRAYIDAITWECVRLYMPSVAAAFAIYHTSDRARWPKLYYFGGRDEALTESMTDAEVMRIVVTDSLNVTATVLTLSQLFIKGSDMLFNTALWAFPSLQVSLIGIWIVGSSYTIKRPRQHIFMGGAVLILLIGSCTGVILMSSTVTKIQAWLPATMLFIFMATPFCLYLSEILITSVVLVAIMGRVGGLAFTALLPGYFVPSPYIKHPVFGTAYLVMGIAGGILAVYGRFRLKHICLVLQQGETPRIGASLMEGMSTLATFRKRLRDKRRRKYVLEKDGRAVPQGCTRWSQRHSGTYQPIIQQPERAYCSELMADEYPRPQPRTVHDSPDEEIRRNAYSHKTPKEVIQVIEYPTFSESIESVFFSDRSRARSPPIKRKPVGSDSQRRRERRRGGDDEKYITNISGLFPQIQKPKPVVCVPHSNRIHNGHNHNKNNSNRALSPRSASEEFSKKRRARYFEGDAGRIHVGLQQQQQQQKCRLAQHPLHFGMGIETVAETALAQWHG
ncbi:uncharacterized protein PADG_07906 [Paracoccidioides brasiliensis Pb18]|uniref:Uncharacterized protein n=1 Tax=Paracoccidioides brasiliensis (strain Pb18) TaxID=502780 RepID=C1GKP9_PARBD|nr:uncharacterized protein PADG_07906 [Paracoccidioides brasiliensis Pb18]EEH43086.1 hypothetical protein PADG_07906 [Paracoccidioides brasiliensis Pb18]